MLRCDSVLRLGELWGRGLVGLTALVQGLGHICSQASCWWSPGLQQASWSPSCFLESHQGSATGLPQSLPRPSPGCQGWGDKFQLVGPRARPHCTGLMSSGGSHRAASLGARQLGLHLKALGDVSPRPRWWLGPFPSASSGVWALLCWEERAQSSLSRHRLLPESHGWGLRGPEPPV